MKETPPPSSPKKRLGFKEAAVLAGIVAAGGGLIGAATKLSGQHEGERPSARAGYVKGKKPTQDVQLQKALEKDLKDLLDELKKPSSNPKGYQPPDGGHTEPVPPGSFVRGVRRPSEKGSPKK